jgi:hypothetical protein
MARKLSAHEIRTSNEVHPNPEMPRGRQRAVDDTTRRVIAAHRVNGYSHLCQASDQWSVISDR